MFGPVSLSATYPRTAKDLMVFYYDHYFGQEKNFVNPVQPYQFSNTQSEIKELFSLEDKKQDFKILKSSLGNMNVSVPTLYKQYSDIAQDGGVKFLGFNIDPNFGDCIDGFILVEVDKIKESAKKIYR